MITGSLLHMGSQNKLDNDTVIRGEREMWAIGRRTQSSKGDLEEMWALGHKVANV